MGFNLLKKPLVLFFKGGGGAVVPQRSTGKGNSQRHCRCSHVGSGQFISGTYGEIQQISPSVDTNVKNIK